MDYHWPTDIKEFIRDLLRKSMLADLRKEIQEGVDELDRGEGMDGEEFFKTLEQKHKHLFDQASELDELRLEIQIGIDQANRKELIPMEKAFQFLDERIQNHPNHENQ